MCLAALLAIALPQFLRTPLTNDTALYDLQSRMVREGAVPYRDVLEPNLPGVVWLHLGVRELFGASSEAMRGFDLGVLAVMLLAASALLRSARRRPVTAGWFALAAMGFYLSMSEWCHTQRDTWMLAPALIALCMRCRHVRQRSNPPPLGASRFLGVSTFVEGLVWGAAVWIKPHVVLPAAGVWLAGSLLVRSWRQILSDAALLLAGGLTAGAVGVGWLVHGGAWPHFLETMREWNPGYFEAGRRNWSIPRFAAMTFRMWPWFALHLLAVPLALRVVWRAASRRSEAQVTDLENSETESLACAAGWSGGRRDAVAMLLAVFYLCWFAQALTVQHLFDYVHVPPILLAVLFLIVYTTGAVRGLTARGRIAWAGFALLAVTASPVFRAERLGAWGPCVTGPVTPKLQDRLTYFDNPRHDDLQRVAEFLLREGVTDRDVCCFNSDFVGLYNDLRLDPPTRFVYLQELLVYFPDRRQEMLEAVAASDHRFVVTDLVGCGMSREQASEVGQAGPLGPPPSYPAGSGAYPWCCPVVYRSGTYLVHRVDGAIGGEIEPFLLTNENVGSQ